MSQAQGTVFTDGDARVEGAVVVARKNGQMEYTSTDDDGDFKFSNLAGGSVGAGRWAPWLQVSLYSP